MLSQTVVCSFLFALRALSSPITPREDSSSPRVTFGIIAARSASPVHLRSVNANGGAFWIGKETASYCPLTDQSQCPPGNSTVLAAGGGGASMVCVAVIPFKCLADAWDQNVVVPGGQQVYVAPNGALRFTTAHSAYVPAGSAIDGFNATVGEINGSLGRFTFNGLGADGFLACPVNADGTEPYQVFANVKGLSDHDVPGECKDKCLGFSALTGPYKADDPSAFVWQYT
ncbi:MAG: hypothetical protein LQ345_005495 [Seirophora villosa]|nr:MAG: hypothetical protein LQ345_005495 [Seirophora villosa]